MHLVDDVVWKNLSAPPFFARIPAGFQPFFTIESDKHETSLPSTTHHKLLL